MALGTAARVGDAASGGQTAVLQTLHDKDAIVDARWRGSRTALTLTAVEASVTTVQLRLARCVDIAG